VNWPLLERKSLSCHIRGISKAVYPSIQQVEMSLRDSNDTGIQRKRKTSTYLEIPSLGAERSTLKREAFGLLGNGQYILIEVTEYPSAIPGNNYVGI